MTRALAIVPLLVFTLAACASDPQVSASAGASASPSDRPAGPSSARATCSGEKVASFHGEELGVRLRIVPCTVMPGRSPSAVLVNIGEGELGHSFGFQLERRTAAGWHWVNRRQGFPLPLIYLRPGERSDPESLAVYFDEPEPVELPPGLYRVSKSVDLAPGTPRPPTLSVSATFRVRP